ncbi:hypothetical protein HanPSC8_Chr17g0763691 [Helianthus annuus]|nr:hypothetical protein HanPSC8_Chr17g0763691 [Helianthus annuus]
MILFPLQILVYKYYLYYYFHHCNLKSSYSMDPNTSRFYYSISLGSRGNCCIHFSSRRIHTVSHRDELNGIENCE